MSDEPKKPNPFIVSNIVSPSRFSREYSDDIAERITDYFISGHSFAKIAAMDGMPSQQMIYRWAKDKEEFREKLEAARAVRALALESKALEAAEEATTKEGRPDSRLKFDAAVWAAEKNDPKVYGRQVKVEATLAPINFIVDTGVPKSEYRLERERVEKELAERAAKAITVTPVIEGVPTIAYPEEDNFKEVSSNVPRGTQQVHPEHDQQRVVSAMGASEEGLSLSSEALVTPKTPA